LECSQHKNFCSYKNTQKNFFVVKYRTGGSLR
jgi:hypothetical protein